MKSLKLLSSETFNFSIEGLERLKEMGVEIVPSICRMCTAGCSILAEVRNNEVVRIYGNPYAKYHNKGHVCPRGNSGPLQVNNPDRLRRPLIRVGGKRGEWNFREVSYEEAIEEVAKIIKEKWDEGEPHKVILIVGQAAAATYADPLSMAVVPTLKTNNVVNIPISTCIGSKLLAWGFSGVPGHHAFLVPDYERTKFFLSFGRNLGGSVAVGQTAKAGHARDGYKLVVLDPRLSEWASKADLWIPIRPGTDLAFFLAMINVIIQEGLYDREYLAKYTNAPMLVDKKTMEPVETKKVKIKNPVKEFEAVDFLVYDEASQSFKFSREARLPSLDFEGEYKGREVTTVFNLLKEHVKEYTPEWAERITGVPAETIRRVAIEFAITKPASIEPGWSANKYYNHFQLYRAAAVLSAITGNLLRPGGVVLSMGGIKLVLSRASPPIAKGSELWKVEAQKKIRLSDGSEGKILIPYGHCYHSLKDLISKEKGWVIIIIGANPARTFMGEVFQEIAKSENVDLIANIGLMKDDTVLYSDIFIPECSYLERAYQVSGVPFSLAKSFMAAFPAIEPIGECKAMNEIILSILDYIDPKLKAEFAKALAKALGCPKCAEDFAKAAMEYKGGANEFTEKIIEIQAKHMGLDYNKLRREGIINLTDESWGLKMNEMILKNGWLNSPTGKVEILSLKLLKLPKMRGLEIKPEWHPLPTWVPPRWMSKSLGPDEFVPVTGKQRNMSYTSTQDNPVLAYMIASKHDGMVWIHPSRAEQLGISEGDWVEICGRKCIKARVHVTEGIHPDAIYIPPNFGSEVDLLFARHKELKFNLLQSPEDIDPITGTHLMTDLIVKVRRI